MNQETFQIFCKLTREIKYKYHHGFYECSEELLDNLIKVVNDVESSDDVFETCMEMFHVAIELHAINAANYMLDTLKKIATELSSNELFIKYLDATIVYHETMNNMESLEQIYENYYHLKKKQMLDINSLKMSNIKSKMLLKERIEEQKQYTLEAKRLKIRCEHDELTMLPNRYLLNEYCEEQFQKALKQKKKLGVVIVDVDNFKEFNDYYGHLGGDKCLREVADSILECCENQFCARFGGDEFFIVTYDMDQNEIFAMSEKIRKSVEEKEMIQPEGVIPRIVSVSQGIVVAIPSEEQAFIDFWNAADVALYQGKKNSKNIISIGNLPTITE